ncbi:hypothetical protein EsDP_00003287 [Epichloe bromicola]|uniref:Ankyrin repeat protein n=1 Tax=Epichloe bromicola TaxID=79588 RepID=A0ABQ0CNC0_9HYPO
MVPNSTIPFTPLARILGSPSPPIPRAHCASSTMPPADTNQADEVIDAREFSAFLRRTTCLSNLTDHTTGSFHRVLSDYSEPYVQTVKRLVKRFTAPKANRSSLPRSFPDEKGAGESWANDEDRPPELDSRPFNIPGDYHGNSSHGLRRKIRQGRHFFMCWTIAFKKIQNTFVTYSRDCFRRSFLHLLIAEKYPQELLDQVAVFCDQDILAARDAFGLGPAHAATGMELDRNGIVLQNSFGSVSASDPRIAKESKLLENVRLAGQCPSLQGDHGRNGLHCLAMASLSSATVANKYHLQSPPREKITKRHRNPQHALDSSTDKLNFRLGLVIGLLHAGVDPNQHDNDGNTTLMAFVAELPGDDDYQIQPQILEALVNKGANVNARNRRGETALHVAVRCGRKLPMRTLVRLGASVHSRDSAGRSLLDIADVKMVNCESDEHTTDYAHFEACRAWLSGKGMALQRPTVIDEWGM